MSSIVAKRLAEQLERAGFVVMKRRPIDGPPSWTHSRHRSVR
jgi:hypothetical protein